MCELWRLGKNFQTMYISFLNSIITSPNSTITQLDSAEPSQIQREPAKFNHYISKSIITFPNSTYTSPYPCLTNSNSTINRPYLTVFCPNSILSACTNLMISDINLTTSSQTTKIIYPNSIRTYPKQMKASPSLIHSLPAPTKLSPIKVQSLPTLNQS